MQVIEKVCRKDMHNVNILFLSIFCILVLVGNQEAYAQVNDTNPLVKVDTFFKSFGGGWFGLSIFTIFLVFIGFMASPKTVHIYTIIIMIFAAILNAIHVFEFPAWMWGLMIFMSIVLVLQRKK